MLPMSNNRKKLLALHKMANMEQEKEFAFLEKFTQYSNSLPEDIQVSLIQIYHLSTKNLKTLFTFLQQTLKEKDFLPCIKKSFFVPLTQYLDNDTQSTISCIPNFLILHKDKIENFSHLWTTIFILLSELNSNLILLPIDICLKNKKRAQINDFSKNIHKTLTLISNEIKTCKNTLQQNVPHQKEILLQSLDMILNEHKCFTHSTRIQINPPVHLENGQKSFSLGRKMKPSYEIMDDSPTLPRKNFSMPQSTQALLLSDHTLSSKDISSEITDKQSAHQYLKQLTMLSSPSASSPIHDTITETECKMREHHDKKTPSLSLYKCKINVEKASYQEQTINSHSSTHRKDPSYCCTSKIFPTSNIALVSHATNIDNAKNMHDSDLEQYSDPSEEDLQRFSLNSHQI